MHFLINSTLSLDIIAMAASIAIVVWSFQIKNGNLLAMVGGTLLFILSVLSISSTGFYASRIMMNHDALVKEHGMMQHMMHEGEKAPQ